MLFADVCDSTTIYEAIGDAKALALINGLQALLADKVTSHGGTTVKMLGDGMVCQFPDPDSAFHAACEMQIAAGSLEGEVKLAIKIGMNWGPLVVEGGDIFGDTVNVCARISALANPRQVLTTQQTVAALSEELQERCRYLLTTKVKGRVEEVNVSEILWRSDPDQTKMFTRSGLERAAAAAAAKRAYYLKITYGGDSIVVEPSASVRLGRDKGNEIVVNSALASRVHARIYGRGDNFVIADQSSNGTFLLVDGSSREVRLRREEAVMGERGYIGLGGPAGSPGEHVLRYRLESRKK